MVNEFGYCSLDYEVAYARDSGVITCRATNKYGVDQTSATLIVKDEKGLVEETQLPEGRKGAHRIDEMERMAHEGGPYGVTAEEETEKMKPEIVLLPEPVSVLEGETARFRCRVTGYPAPKVNWYLNGQLIRKSKRYRLRYDGIYYLEIIEIKSYDAGEVKVVADNNLGSAEHIVKLEIQQKEDFRTHLRRAPEMAQKTEYTIKKIYIYINWPGGPQEVAQINRTRLILITVSTAVKVKKTLKNLNVVQTQEAVFSLELTHENVRGAQWIKNGVEIQPSDKYEISIEGMVHTLKINNCNTHDESVYSFKLGKLSANARLNVETIKILKKPKDVTSLLGATAVFEVGISEDDIPVKWMFKNTELKPNEHYRILSEKKTHKLIVQDVDNSKEVTRPLKSVEVLEKHRATFEFEVNEDDVEGRWMRNGVELQLSVEERFSYVTIRKLHRLTISETYRSDAGEYTFIAGSLGLATLQEKVQGIPPAFLKPLIKKRVFENDSLTFYAEVFGLPSPEVRWFCNKTQLVEDNRVTMERDGDSISLTIHNVTKADQGEYICEAVNYVGEARSVALVVVVSQEVRFMPAPPAVTHQHVMEFDVEEDDSSRSPSPQEILLEVELDENEVKEFEKQVKIITIPEYTADNKSMIISLDVLPSIYEEGAVDFVTQEHDDLKIAFEVTEMPPRFINPICDMETPEGTTIMFECSLMGIPSPIVSWFKGDKKIPHNNKKYVHSSDGDNHFLKICKVGTQDSGVYTCRAINVVGETLCRACLVVQDAKKIQF
uniref:Ig-like domain-containing protein n=1 Tax=Stegastes partitus TaxID=144197 RepID=A0A3B5BB45_9TELE